MGGASRNERRRRQEAVAPRPSVDRVPGSGRKDNRVKVGIIVAVVIVVVFAAIFVVMNRPWGSTAQATAASYPVAVDGVVVTAGQANAPVTVDVYEDFLCPNCEIFEKAYGNEIVSALNEGKLTVRYHSIAILDSRSTPPGYSTRAANAALCAVPAGIYPTYHQKLFASQPSEGSAGLTDAQLVQFGTELGAKGDFAGCVTGAKNAAAVTAETNKAIADPALQTNGLFGTPTVVANGAMVDLNNTGWLKAIIG